MNISASMNGESVNIVNVVQNGLECYVTYKNLVNELKVTKFYNSSNYSFAKDAVILDSSAVTGSGGSALTEERTLIVSQTNPDADYSDLSEALVQASLNSDADANHFSWTVLVDDGTYNILNLNLSASNNESVSNVVVKPIYRYIKQIGENETLWFHSNVTINLSGDYGIKLYYTNIRFQSMTLNILQDSGVADYIGVASDHSGGLYLDSCYINLFLLNMGYTSYFFKQISSAGGELGIDSSVIYIYPILGTFSSGYNHILFDQSLCTHGYLKVLNSKIFVSDGFIDENLTIFKNWESANSVSTCQFINNNVVWTISDNSKTARGILLKLNTYPDNNSPALAFNKNDIKFACDASCAAYMYLVDYDSRTNNGKFYSQNNNFKTINLTKSYLFNIGAGDNVYSWGDFLDGSWISSSGTGTLNLDNSGQNSIYTTLSATYWKTSSPTTMKSAVDRLAARLYAISGAIP